MSENVGKTWRTRKNKASGKMAVFGPLWESMDDHFVPKTESVVWHISQCFLPFLYLPTLLSPCFHLFLFTLFVAFSCLLSYCIHLSLSSLLLACSAFPNTHTNTHTHTHNRQHTTAHNSTPQYNHTQQNNTTTRQLSFDPSWNTDRGVPHVCKFFGVNPASAMKVHAWTCAPATDRLLRVVLTRAHVRNTRKEVNYAWAGQKSGKTLAKARFDINGQIVLETWVWKRKTQRTIW